MTRRGAPRLQRSSPTCGTSSASACARWSPTDRTSKATDDAPLTCLALVESLGVERPRGVRALAPRLGAAPARHAADPAGGRVPPVARRVSARVRRDHPRARARVRRRSVRRRRRSRARICAAPARRRSRAISSTCAKASSRPAAGRSAIADLVDASAPAFAALLRNVARLNGAPRPRPRRRHARGRPRGRRLPTASSATCWRSSGRPTIPTADAARLFPQYLAAVEQLARVVDTWRA